MSETLTATAVLPDDTETETVETVLKPLTLADRCDRCSAAAVAQALVTPTTVLLFCGHHWRANLDKIKESALAWDVDGEHDFVHTWRSHFEQPWKNEMRDAGSAV